MKKTKLTFELIFIFVLPIIFMIFNMTYSDVVLNGVQTSQLFYETSFVGSLSPISQLFTILFDLLMLNTESILFKLLVDYTTLWFIMFILWHVFYGLFDIFVHLFTKSRYKEGE